MGIIRRPDPVKVEDADIPVEEIICIIEENKDSKTLEIICMPEELINERKPIEEIKAEIKPKSVITSTTTGEQFGNWTPFLRNSGTIDIDVRNAFYTKIGQLVTCTFDIVITNIIERNNSPITLNGLPVNSINSPGVAGSAYLSYFRTPNNEMQYISGTINGNDNRADLWCELRGRKGLFHLTQNDIQINAVLIGTITYITNS